MTKIATLLGCVLVLTCTLAMAQKHPATPRTAKSSSGSCTGPITIKGSSGPQTCKAFSSHNNASSPTTVLANASTLGRRIANQKLGKAMPRPGTPDFLPASTTVSGSQLP